jgi:hypothetical protein
MDAAAVVFAVRVRAKINSDKCRPDFGGRQGASQPLNEDLTGNGGNGGLVSELRKPPQRKIVRVTLMMPGTVVLWGESRENQVLALMGSLIPDDTLSYPKCDIIQIRTHLFCLLF